jgi:hypothetical protein
MERDLNTEIVTALPMHVGFEEIPHAANALMTTTGTPNGRREEIVLEMKKNTTQIRKIEEEVTNLRKEASWRRGERAVIQGTATIKMAGEPRVRKSAATKAVLIAIARAIMKERKIVASLPRKMMIAKRERCTPAGKELGPRGIAHVERRHDAKRSKRDDGEKMSICTQL